MQSNMPSRNLGVFEHIDGVEAPRGDPDPLILERRFLLRLGRPSLGFILLDLVQVKNLSRGVRKVKSIKIELWVS